MAERNKWQETGPETEPGTEVIEQALAEEQPGLEERIEQAVQSPGVEDNGSVESVEKVERMSISLDNSVEEVVLYDQEGVTLVFEDEPGRFLHLPSQAVRGLSPENKDRYALAYGTFKVLEEEAEMPQLDLQVSGRQASATGKTDVYGKRPGMHYCWKRPDQLRKAVGDGYKVSQDETLDTLVSSLSDGTHRVSAMGEDELLLMEIPEERFKQLDARNHEKAERMAGAVKQGAINEIRKAGGREFDPDKEDGRRYNFGPPADEEGNPLPNQL